MQASPPGPKGHWFLGSLREITSDPLRFYLGAWRAHGDYVRARAFAGVYFYVVAHPDAVEHIMDKRRSIIQAARARFGYYGLQKTTMQEIATDADVAVGTLYRYFKDKDDLFVACTEEFVAHHRRQIEELLSAGQPPDQKLRQYLQGRFRTAREVSTRSTHAAELARAVLRVKPHRLDEEAAMMASAITQLLEQGNGAKVWHIADPRRDARVLLFSIAYFFPNATMNVSRWPTAEEFSLVLDWFIEMWSRSGLKSFS